MLTTVTQEPEGSLDQSCPSCNGTDLIQDIDTGEVICSRCGTVVDERSYDLGPEWRSYTRQERQDRARTGHALTNKIYDRGLSTVMTGNVDARGRQLDNETMRKMNRLKRLNRREKNYESWDKNLKIALSEMDRMCTELHLPDYIHEEAAKIYRRVLKKDLVRGRSIDGFVGASIFAACRLSKLPYSIKKISEISMMDSSEIGYHYRMLVKELDMKMPLDKPNKFVSGMASRLGLNADVEQHSMRIIEKAKEEKLVVGKNPRGVAAAALYLACINKGYPVTQTEVANVADVSEVTMRKRFKEYEPIQNFIE